ncbi:hypothetical protein [Spirosoma foliorum]|uniref:Uncharacterized protein n=1 Tax=Spirosoma foliorum TaxID=2710596 RepID=A0A7G5GN80_9BACT|nr:hypothetical protein [Spirosoma foliorum]QMW00322.1 hypothetical protein H3H32_20100 [Spirosoma foliorum]
MKITPKGLLQLGFTESSEHPKVYTYKPGLRAVVRGRLDAQPGSFHIDMFKVPLTRIGDLAYMLEIVDYYRR